MGRIALAYDDAEIRRMAEYFRVQIPQRQAQAVASNRLDLGRELHQQFCRDCHGDLNSPPESGAVTLNGQWQSYLRWTLQDYFVGINRSRPGMSRALSALIRRKGMQGLESLILYYGSDQP